ncbi:hypothetical protein M9978_02480 [Sphingomonas sp. MG17]|uniref:Uncharacterized protein n=1 Tax=Sphingomonas tagetis TaxID=2949092 RepID=A0A9X2KN46_9SPHN|nr:hypothetical protein [Sphingomonas tagetis]MCP3729283.1 hypothetical protein [Sphingomonas tagetis]
MTGSPLTPEQQLLVREIASEEAAAVAAYPSILAVIALVGVTLMAILLVAQWVFE